MDVTTDAAPKRRCSAFGIASKVAFDLTRIRLVGRVDHPSPSGSQHLHTHARRGYFHLSTVRAFTQRTTRKSSDIWEFFSQSGAHRPR